MKQKKTTVSIIWLRELLCLISVLCDQYGKAMIDRSTIPKIFGYVYWIFVYFHMICVSLFVLVFLVKNWMKYGFSKYSNSRLLLKHPFNCSIAVFISISKIWLSKLLIIKLVPSAYITGLKMSHITFHMQLAYNRKSRRPNMNLWGTPSVTDSHLE